MKIKIFLSFIFSWYFITCGAQPMPRIEVGMESSFCADTSKISKSLLYEKNNISKFFIVDCEKSEKAYIYVRPLRNWAKKIYIFSPLFVWGHKPLHTVIFSTEYFVHFPGEGGDAEFGFINKAPLIGKIGDENITWGGLNFDLYKWNINKAGFDAKILINCGIEIINNNDFTKENYKTIQHNCQDFIDAVYNNYKKRFCKKSIPKNWFVE